jgi:hypothetical protein
MNYRASGTLEAFRRTDDNLCLILVKWGDKYVVSRYREGEQEWIQGNYFWDKASADACFDKKYAEYSRLAKETA